MDDSFYINYAKKGLLAVSVAMLIINIALCLSDLSTFDRWLAINIALSANSTGLALYINKHCKCQ